MKPSIQLQLEQLRMYDKRFLEIGLKILGAYQGAFYPVDMIVIGILKRSLSLLDGFCTMIERSNNLSAASFVRLHLDSLLRFHAFHLVKNPHELANKMIDGQRLDKLRDKNNKQLHDRYLAEEVNKKYPWVLRVYQETSGLIHLSHKHYSFAIAEVEEKEPSIQWIISHTENHIPEETILEYIQGFRAICDAILDYSLGWYISKDHPEILKKNK